MTTIYRIFCFLWAPCIAAILIVANASLLTTIAVVICASCLSIVFQYPITDANKLNIRRTFDGAVITIIMLVAITACAITHGLYTLQTPTATAIHVITSDTTPHDQSRDFSITSDGTIASPAKPPYILAFYRFGCPDCEATHHELKAWAAKQGIHIFWISTRTDTGRALFNQAKLDSVPSVMAIRSDGATASCVAFTVNDDNQAELNTDALDELAAFLNEGA